MSIYPDRKAGKLTGRFRVEVQLGDRRKRGRAGSLREAQKLEAELKVALASGEPATPRNRSACSTVFRALTMGEGAKRAKGLLWDGQDTEASSLRKLDRVVEIVGSDLSLDAFDANTLDTLVLELKGRGCSDSTINRYLSNVSAFMKFCFKRGFRSLPVPEVEWRDEGEGRIRWLTYDEEAEVIDLLPEPLGAIVHVAIRTGMRASEIMGLKPEQVTSSWVHLWDTKNGSSRSVPLSKQLHDTLAPLVSAGLPDYWHLRYEWDLARKAMGLEADPLFVFHACRHTFATRAIQAGVNPVVLQKLMGHKSIQTTLRYTHVDDKTAAEAALSAIAFHDQKVGELGGGIGPLRRSTLHRGERLTNSKARWRSGYAEDCKSLHAGSIPARASTDLEDGGGQQEGER